MYLIQKLTFLGTIMCSDGMKNNKQQILVHKYVYITCTSAVQLVIKKIRIRKQIPSEGTIHTD